MKGGHFLARHNKQAGMYIINMLSVEKSEKKVLVPYAEDNADLMIVQTTVSIAEYKTIFLVIAYNTNNIVCAITINQIPNCS